MNSRRPVRNRLLGITRNTIPYVRELRSVTGSISATVVMQQLDYWFIRYPQGFYKFLEATPNAPLYRSGQSWCEELGFTKDEFRTAFDKIGYRWPSKSRFDAAPDKFLGKFYASYVDRRTNLTFYFRNHELVDLILDRLLENNHSDFQEIDNPNLQEIGNPDLQQMGNPDSGKLTLPISGNRQSRLREIGNPDILYTETTTEPTEIISELLRETHYDSGRTCSSELYFPETFNQNERNGILHLVSDLDPAIAQNIIDEIAGIRIHGKVRQSVISLASGLVKRAKAGNFNPAVALEVSEKRKQKQLHQTEKSRQAASHPPATKEVRKKALADLREMLKPKAGNTTSKSGNGDP